jgi:hypothetical protein
MVRSQYLDRGGYWLTTSCAEQWSSFWDDYDFGGACRATVEAGKSRGTHRQRTALHPIERTETSVIKRAHRVSLQSEFSSAFLKAPESELTGRSARRENWGTSMSACHLSRDHPKAGNADEAMGEG